MARSQSLSLRQHNIGHRRNNGYLLGTEATGADPVLDVAVATNVDQRKALCSPLSGESNDSLHPRLRPATTPAESKVLKRG